MSASCQGHLCPAGTALPQPCPSGTFSNNTGAHNLSVCAPCPSGRYCHSAGTTIPEGAQPHHYFRIQTSQLTGITSHKRVASSFFFFFPGTCLQGFFCRGGATDPAPQTSDDSPNNGPCPLGHYCPAGCLSPIPCPPGSIRNSTGATSVTNAY